MRISELVRSVLAEMERRNQEVPSSLRGGTFCAAVERPPDGEPWVQVKTGVLNFFYPSDEPPLPTIASSGVALPSGTTCATWEPWKYATLEFEPPPVEELAELVEGLFGTFYGLPEDEPLLWEIIDTRTS